MLTQDLKTEMSTLLRRYTFQYKNTNLDEMRRDLSDADLRRIQRAVVREIHEQRINYAHAIREFRRTRTAEILKLKDCGMSVVKHQDEMSAADAAALRAEIKELRDLANKILVLTPRLAEKLAIENLQTKRAKSERSRKEFAEEEERMKRPLDISEKLLFVALAPVALPTLAVIHWYSKYSEKPSVKAKQEAKKRENFRKNWQYAHKLQRERAEEKVIKFRELYLKAHQK